MNLLEGMDLATLQRLGVHVEKADECNMNRGNIHDPLLIILTLRRRGRTCKVRVWQRMETWPRNGELKCVLTENDHLACLVERIAMSPADVSKLDGTLPEIPFHQRQQWYKDIWIKSDKRTKDELSVLLFAEP